ncbi:MAG: hypothetical protein K2Q18_14995 [Bdellovibrionales bacterium]|nr:hypothetical protein [Bdellovibrionales bacterium]
MKTTFSIFIMSFILSLYNQAYAVNAEFFSHPEEIILYNENQPNAKGLKKCAFVDTKQYSCLFLESPFIGHQKEKVTIKDVMNKTMASRKSYLETFENVLKMMPEETLMMFGPVNAVVISDRINPSFYSFDSGAIYISSSYLWKTAEEKELSSAKKDFRDDFGSTINFSEEADYYKNGESLYKSVKQTTRTEIDLAPILFKVLFHELSHANDFFPRSFYISDDVNVSKTYSEMASDRLDDGYLLSQKIRLSSALLERTSEILYFGKDPNDIELNMNPRYVVREFIEGDASDLYAYSNPREDLAMLVENNLMFYYFGYSPVTIFIKYPKANFKVPKNYKKPILGGVKNKIAAPLVKERSKSVLTMIFGADYAEKVITKLEKVKQVIIPENISWEKLKNI